MAVRLLLAAVVGVATFAVFAPSVGAADCFAPDPATGELRRVECPPPTTAAPVTTSPPAPEPTPAPAAPVTTRAPVATTRAPAAAPTAPPAAPAPPETVPTTTLAPTASTLTIAPVETTTTSSTLLTAAVPVGSARTVTENGGINTYVVAGAIAALATLLLIAIFLIDGARRRLEPPMET